VIRQQKTKMKILAIETATDACSAALLIDNETRVEYELAPRKHTQLILKQVESLMASAQLSLQDMDAIAFGKGPGAFTGLRIAAGVTQGLALAADLPVIPVSTLAAMAQQAYQHYQADHILVALDARINEVYWGEYQINLDQSIACLMGKEQVILPEKVQITTSSETDNNFEWLGVGSGWGVYETELKEIVTSQQTKHALTDIYPELHPSAEQIAQLAAYEYQQGNLLSVEQAQPIYLRDKVADTIAERKAKS
jgi:tRNA threonylcarbamoyladenosine biosynthesis protein TsaB